MLNKRIEWVDYIKGIAILLVIAGHTITSYAIRGAIFSFHMPLFFLMSGVTYRASSNMGELKMRTYKSLYKLIFPAVVLFMIRAIVFWGLGINNSLDIVRCIKTLLFASGTRVKCVFCGDVDAIGAVWFVFALVGSKIIYDVINIIFPAKLYVAVGITISVVGVVMSRIIWLPFSMDIAFAAVIFLICGKYIRNAALSDIKHNVFYGFAAFILWSAGYLTIYYLKHCFLDMSGRLYPMYPLCFVTALLGTIMFSFLSNLMVRFNVLKSVVCYLGKNSLILFFVHYMDRIWEILWRVNDSNGIYASIENTVVRILLDLVFFSIVMIIINYIKSKKVRAKV